MKKKMGCVLELKKIVRNKLKKMIALSKKEMDAINMLPKKEKEKEITEWCENFFITKQCVLN
ncbi:MAG: hypothetical protein FJX00_02710 [Alphaproteobacteria bacterium]|nr:hypothetical protein [Alphaproteobacteria bacterium]